MEALDRILVQLNPQDQYRVATYSVFLVRGDLTMKPEDLQGLWLDWHQDTSATYDKAWESEKSKLAQLFSGFQALTVEGKVAQLSLIYPDGRELAWTPKQMQWLQSTRGPQIKQVLLQTSPSSSFGVAVVLQFKYDDADTLYQAPETRNPYLQEHLPLAKLDPHYTVSPTCLAQPMPLETLRDFWYHFRNTNPTLVSKYGPGRNQPSPNLPLKLYQNGGFEALFQRLVELDRITLNKKLIAISFLHDAGFQYVIYRHLVAGQEPFQFAKVPPTPGTKLICSKAPKDIRMIVKAIYIEQ